MTTGRKTTDEGVKTSATAKANGDEMRNRFTMVGARARLAPTPLDPKPGVSPAGANITSSQEPVSPSASIIPELAPQASGAMGGRKPNKPYRQVATLARKRMIGLRPWRSVSIGTCRGVSMADRWP